MLRGTIEVTFTDGDRRRFGPGDLVLATDTTGSGHVTTGVGDAPFSTPHATRPPAAVSSARSMPRPSHRARAANR
ncbi:hypothetical protein ACQEU6_28700 [Spirillospora sp. CA-108201]